MADLATLQAAVEKTQTDLNEFYADQLDRLPDQAAWDALTKDERINEWDTEGALKFAVRTAKKALKEELERREAFYNARQAAFDEFESQKTTERGLLNALWQEKEDHDFNPDYQPSTA